MQAFKFATTRRYYTLAVFLILPIWILFLIEYADGFSVTLPRCQPLGMPLQAVPETPTVERSNDEDSVRNKNAFYSYKHFKRLGLPALAYSLLARAAVRVSAPFRRKEKVTTVVPAQLERRKVVVITGSNTGVGYETARALVQQYGYHVVLACRSAEKGRAACQAINEEKTSENQAGEAIFLQPLDVSNMTSIRSFVTSLQSQVDQVDVLINNAGQNSKGLDATAPPTLASDDDPSIILDPLFATNFLGHFLLTNLLLEAYPCTSSTSGLRRIVNLSSVMHHFPNADSNISSDAQLDAETYWKQIAVLPKEYLGGNADITARKTYGPSKLAALLFSVELNRRYSKSRGICSIAVNPGSVNSDIWRNYPSLMRKLYRWLYLSAQQGASTSVTAAVEDDWGIANSSDGSSALYLQPYGIPFLKNDRPPYPMFEMLGPYQGSVRTTPRLPSDEGHQAAQSLFAVCEELTGCDYPQM